MMRSFIGVESRNRALRIALVMACVIAGCSPVTVPPTTSVYDASDFIWHNPSTLALASTDSSRASETVTFRSSGDSLYLTQSTPWGSPLTIPLTIAGDSVTIASLNEKTFFSLPGGTYLSADGLPASSGSYIPTCMLTEDATGGLIVGTDSGGVFQYVISGIDSSFIYRGLHGMRITNLSEDHVDKTCYAATVNGDIYHSDVSLSNWSLVTALGQGQLSALAIGDKQEIYASAVNSTGVFRLNAGNTSWIKMPVIPTSQVADIAYNSKSRTMVAGALDGRVGIFDNNSGVATAAGIGGGPIHCVAGLGNASTVGVATDNGVFETSDLKNWLQSPWSSAASLKNLRWMQTGGGVTFLIDNTSVYYHSASNPSALPGTMTPAPPGNLLRVGFTTEAVVLTSLGIFGFSTSPARWTIHHKGLEFSREARPGSLTLLRRSMRIGDSWPAAILMTGSGSQSVAHAITARVIDHVDQLDATTPIADVLVVRYAIETASGNVDTTYPYWVLYYQRGGGLVVLDNIQTGSDKVIRTTFR